MTVHTYAMQDPSRGYSFGMDPLADYNPFSNPFSSNQTTASLDQKPQGSSVPSTSAVSAKQEKQQPQKQTSESIADFEKRQEELERKAQELQRREEELQNSVLFNAAKKDKNWPPLPSKFCVEPCFYQDINVEIKVEFQPIVSMIYYIWIAHTCLYVLNVGGCLGLFIQMGEGTMFGLSILYCFLFTPASYLFWFRPAYKAFRSDNSFNFMVFFVFFFAQLVATVIQAVGLPNLGTCGFIVALAAIGNQESPGDLAIGIIVLVIACGFGLVALGDFFLLVRVSRLYRSTGASFSKARSEFTSGVMRNQHVRQATSDAISSAVRVQMDSIVN